MKALITTSGRESLVKTVMFLQAIGYRFPSLDRNAESQVEELYDYLRNRWDTEKEDVIAICVAGENLTVNTARFYRSEYGTAITEVEIPIK